MRLLDSVASVGAVLCGRRFEAREKGISISWWWREGDGRDGELGPGWSVRGKEEGRLALKGKDGTHQARAAVGGDARGDGGEGGNMGPRERETSQLSDGHLISSPFPPKPHIYLFFSSHESSVFVFYMAFFGKMHPGHDPQRSLLPRSVPLRHVNHQPRQPSLAVQCPVARRGEADFANDQRRVPRRSAILHTAVRYVPNEVPFPVPGRCRLQCKRWGPRRS